MGRGPYDYLTLPSIFLLGGIFIVENGKQKGIYFKVSEKERDLIEQKMALAGVRNMSGFLRKMAIDGYVVNLEIPELTECASLLRYISNNVNQMARHMNSGGAVCPRHLRQAGRNQPAVRGNPGTAFPIEMRGSIWRQHA